MSAPSKDVQDNKTGTCMIPPKLYNPSTLNIVSGWFKSKTKNGQNASLSSGEQKYSFLFRNETFLGQNH